MATGTGLTEMTHSAPSPRPPRIGLTGGIASGKSTVAAWLAEAGFLTIDADRLVAELYAPGELGAAAVRELFGPDMLDERGGVSRPRLAELVFRDDVARRQLESRIHPLVRARFARLATGDPRPAVLEATLLVEAGYAPDFDHIVTVEADSELRLRRAIARGLPEAAARARQSAQGSGEKRRAAAHFVLANDGDLAALRRQVDALLPSLRRRAAPQP
jgi:dephospho-CoA kinase